MEYYKVLFLKKNAGVVISYRASKSGRYCAKQDKLKAGSNYVPGSRKYRIFFYKGTVILQDCYKGKNT